MKFLFFLIIWACFISFKMPGAGKMPWLGVSTGFDCHTMGRIPTFIDAGKHSNILAPPEPEATRYEKFTLFNLVFSCFWCFCSDTSIFMILQCDRVNRYQQQWAASTGAGSILHRWCKSCSYSWDFRWIRAQTQKYSTGSSLLDMGLDAGVVSRYFVLPSLSSFWSVVLSQSPPTS